MMKNEIRNLIFDMGNVLLRYEPEALVQALDFSDKDRRLILEHTFNSSDWALLDLGEIDEEEMARRARAHLPAHLHEAADRMVYAWEQPIQPIDGMAEFIRDCKAAGFGIYLLSNASVRQIEYWPLIPGYEYFDGRIVSAEHHMVKPMPGIYQRLFETYQLKAEECLFMDDRKDNIDGAAKAGMQVFLFRDNVDELRQLVLGA